MGLEWELRVGGKGRGKGERKGDAGEESPKVAAVHAAAEHKDR